MSNSLWPCSNPRPWSQWCHPTISSSVTPFSSCLQSFPASGSFPVSRLFTSGGQHIGASASASVLPMNIQGWFPLELIGCIFLLFKGTLKNLLQHHRLRDEDILEICWETMWIYSTQRRRQWRPTPVLSPGKSHGWRSLVGCGPWCCYESDTTEQLHFTFHFHALEEEMAAHSSVLAWRIPGMGEPGGLPSMGSHRVGHDWSDLAAAAALKRD